MSTDSLTFMEAWKFPSVVSREIKGCSYSATKITDRKFKSGRPVYTTVFYDVCSRAIEERTAMQLVSKRTGKPYYVCESNEAIARGASRRAAVPAPCGADVVAPLCQN